MSAGSDFPARIQCGDGISFERSGCFKTVISIRISAPHHLQFKRLS